MDQWQYSVITFGMLIFDHKQHSTLPADRESNPMRHLAFLKSSIFAEILD
jgi:hypothetical protein